MQDSTRAKNGQKKQPVIRSALSMAMGTLSSRILGFTRDAVMLALFPRSVTDAWVVAFRLPNLFRRLLGEGSLAVSFIPVYVDARALSEEQAHRLRSAIYSIVFSVACVICLTCFIEMPAIIHFLVGDPRGFASRPGAVEQTVYLARIMIFYLLLVSTYAFHMAVANTHGHFFLPAIGPTLFNVGLIAFTILPVELGRWPGSSQSWGVIFGGFLQMFVVAWLLIRLRALPGLTWHWRVPGVIRVFANMGPGLVGIGVFQVMTLISTKLAARLSLGAQSYIYAADRIFELPQSLIAVSLGAALLPRFSELHTAGERGHFLREANAAVRTMLYLMLPAAVGMRVLALPLTQVLFMHGAFSAADAFGTSQVLQVYAVMLLFSSLSRVTAPAFYALKNTWLPASVAFFVLVVYVLAGPWMVDHYGLPGLARATATAAIMNIVLLQIFFHFLIGPLGYPRIFASVARLLPALAVMAMFCHFTWPVLAGNFPRTVSLLLVVTGGAAVYFLVSALCRSPEAEQVRGMLARRFAGKSVVPRS